MSNRAFPLQPTTNAEANAEAGHYSAPTINPKQCHKNRKQNLDYGHVKIATSFPLLATLYGVVVVAGYSKAYA